MKKNILQVESSNKFYLEISLKFFSSAWKNDFDKWVRDPSGINYTFAKQLILVAGVMYLWVIEKFLLSFYVLRFYWH